jgi:hypothetical protein
MGDPVRAARHARSALADGGTVMLVEPYAADAVEDNARPIGRLYYSASTTLCCAHALSEDGGQALGAQAGESRLAEVFAEAGFGTGGGRRSRRSTSCWRRGREATPAATRRRDGTGAA